MNTTQNNLEKNYICIISVSLAQTHMYMSVFKCCYSFLSSYYMGLANEKQLHSIGYEVNRLHQRENAELKRYAVKRK